MKLGLQIVRFDWPGGPASIRTRLADIAGAAEDAGFSSLWVMDHFFQIPWIGAADEPMLEAYTTLGFLAAVTRRIQLGVLVAGIVYRHPGILIKTATTLDVLSGGRSYFGIGAAWYEREARGLGVPFPPVAERFRRLEEALQIAGQMWSGSAAPYQGQYYQLAETLCRPLPVSQPHPPILIGGMGEKKTLRLMAQYAQACNLFANPDTLPTLQHKLDVLRAHCESLGRDFATIELTTLDRAHLAPSQQSPADVVVFCRALAGLGVRHAIFNMPNAHELTPLEAFGREIIPAVAEF